MMKPFSLLIKPASADCNLRCAYCFYLDRCGLYPDSPVHRMNEETLARMISSFMAVPMPQYAFGWQGGEPTLMGLDFFRRAVALQRKHGRPGAVVANGLQTNGTLIDEQMAAFFAEYKFLLGVSLDGPPEVHDFYRKDAGGQGTHARVIRATELLARHGVEYNILTLVNNLNGRDGAALYRYLTDHSFFYQQYIPCVEFDAAGRPLPFAVGSAQWGEFMCGVYDEWRKADTRRVSVRLFDSLIQYYLEGVRNCCNMGGDCRQYFVVEHNGDVYPCDFFVEKKLLLGNVNTDTWEQMQGSALYGEFGAQKSRWSAACAQCDYLEVCAGCCLKNRLHGDNRDPRQLSHLCEGWKIFYAHALPGLRELAQTLRREREAAARRETARPAPRPVKPRPNDPCPCGSGRKFKLCCSQTRRG